LIRNTSTLSAPSLSISKVVLTKPFSPCFQEASLFWQELAMIKLFVMIIVVSISSLTPGHSMKTQNSHFTIEQVWLSNSYAIHASQPLSL
jgi:hypothetical protein